MEKVNESLDLNVEENEVKNDTTSPLVVGEKTEVEKLTEMLDEVSKNGTEDEVKEVLERLSQAINDSMTDEEKHEIRKQQLLDAKLKYRSVFHPRKKVRTVLQENFMGRKKLVTESVIMTNITEPKFDKTYKEKRRKKNKETRKSRKNNR